MTFPIPQGMLSSSRMVSSEKLKSDVSTHFSFGDNWADYSKTINEDRIASAVEDLRRILDRQSLQGVSFCDIGCGSGIHSLAALRLGAGPLLAIDIDPESVATTQGVLRKFAPDRDRRVQVGSVFQLHLLREQFDVVYSWGVLHHTGAMWSAIQNASALVTPGGHLALALYRKTPLCPAWKIEKRIYRKLPYVLQVPLILAYSFVDLARLTIRRTNPITFIREYPKRRGMNYWHDAHDWLGGYPYESASPEETVDFMGRQGFSLVRSWRTEASIGLTGSGCAEYLFRRNGGAG